MQFLRHTVQFTGLSRLFSTRSVGRGLRVRVFKAEFKRGQSKALSRLENAINVYRDFQNFTLMAQQRALQIQRAICAKYNSNLSGRPRSPFVTDLMDVQKMRLTWNENNHSTFHLLNDRVRADSSSNSSNASHSFMTLDRKIAGGGHTLQQMENYAQFWDDYHHRSEQNNRNKKMAESVKQAVEEPLQNSKKRRVNHELLDHSKKQIISRLYSKEVTENARTQGKEQATLAEKFNSPFKCYVDTSNGLIHKILDEHETEHWIYGFYRNRLDRKPVRVQRIQNDGKLVIHIEEFATMDMLKYKYFGNAVDTMHSTTSNEKEDKMQGNAAEFAENFKATDDATSFSTKENAVDEISDDTSTESVTESKPEPKEPKETVKSVAMPCILYNTHKALLNKYELIPKDKCDAMTVKTKRTPKMLKDHFASLTETTVTAKTTNKPEKTQTKSSISSVNRMSEPTKMNKLDDQCAELTKEINDLLSKEVGDKKKGPNSAPLVTNHLHSKMAFELPSNAKPHIAQRNSKKCTKPNFSKMRKFQTLENDVILSGNGSTCTNLETQKIGTRKRKKFQNFDLSETKSVESLQSPVFTDTKPPGTDIKNSSISRNFSDISETKTVDPMYPNAKAHEFGIQNSLFSKNFADISESKSDIAEAEVEAAAETKKYPNRVIDDSRSSNKNTVKQYKDSNKTVCKSHMEYKQNLYQKLKRNEQASLSKIPQSAVNMDEIYKPPSDQHLYLPQDKGDALRQTLVVPSKISSSIEERAEISDKTNIHNLPAAGNIDVERVSQEAATETMPTISTESLDEKPAGPITANKPTDKSTNHKIANVSAIVNEKSKKRVSRQTAIKNALILRKSLRDRDYNWKNRKNPNGTSRKMQTTVNASKDSTVDNKVRILQTKQQTNEEKPSGSKFLDNKNKMNDKTLRDFYKVRLGRSNRSSTTKRLHTQSDSKNGVNNVVYKCLAGVDIMAKKIEVKDDDIIDEKQICQENMNELGNHCDFTEHSDENTMSMKEFLRKRNETNVTFKTNKSEKQCAYEDNAGIIENMKTNSSTSIESEKTEGQLLADDNEANYTTNQAEDKKRLTNSNNNAALSTATTTKHSQNTTEDRNLLEKPKHSIDIAEKMLNIYGEVPPEQQNKSNTKLSKETLKLKPTFKNTMENLTESEKRDDNFDKLLKNKIAQTLMATKDAKTKRVLQQKSSLSNRNSYGKHHMESLAEQWFSKRDKQSIKGRIDAMCSDKLAKAANMDMSENIESKNCLMSFCSKGADKANEQFSRHSKHTCTKTNNKCIVKRQKTVDNDHENSKQQITAVTQNLNSLTVATSADTDDARLIDNIVNDKNAVLSTDIASNDYNKVAEEFENYATSEVKDLNSALSKSNSFSKKPFIMPTDTQMNVFTNVNDVNKLDGPTNANIDSKPDNKLQNYSLPVYNKKFEVNISYLNNDETDIVKETNVKTDRLYNGSNVCETGSNACNENRNLVTTKDRDKQNRSYQCSCTYHAPVFKANASNLKEMPATAVKQYRLGVGHDDINSVAYKPTDTDRRNYTANALNSERKMPFIQKYLEEQKPKLTPKHDSLSFRFWLKTEILKQKRKQLSKITDKALSNMIASKQNTIDCQQNSTGSIENTLTAMQKLSNKMCQTDESLEHTIANTQINNMNFAIDKENYVQVCTYVCSLQTDGQPICIGYGIYFHENNPLNADLAVSDHVSDNIGQLRCALHAIRLAKSAGISKLCIKTHSRFLMNVVQTWLSYCKDNKSCLRDGDSMEHFDLFKELNSLSHDKAIQIKWNLVKSNE